MTVESRKQSWLESERLPSRAQHLSTSGVNGRLWARGRIGLQWESKTLLGRSKRGVKRRRERWEKRRWERGRTRRWERGGKCRLSARDRRTTVVFQLKWARWCRSRKQTTPTHFPLIQRLNDRLHNLGTWRPRRAIAGTGWATSLAMSIGRQLWL